MTTREEIIDLVRKCAEPDGDFGIDNAIAFYHAAQHQAYERAAEVCEERLKEVIPMSYDDWDNGWIAGNQGAAKEVRALIEGDEK